MRLVSKRAAFQLLLILDLLSCWMSVNGVVLELFCPRPEFEDGRRYSYRTYYTEPTIDLPSAMPPSGLSSGSLVWVRVSKTSAQEQLAEVIKAPASSSRISIKWSTRGSIESVAKSRVRLDDGVRRSRSASSDQLSAPPSNSSLRPKATRSASKASRDEARERAPPSSRAERKEAKRLAKIAEAKAKAKRGGGRGRRRPAAEDAPSDSDEDGSDEDEGREQAAVVDESKPRKKYASKKGTGKETSDLSSKSKHATVPLLRKSSSSSYSIPDGSFYYNRAPPPLAPLPFGFPPSNLRALMCMLISSSEHLRALHAIVPPPPPPPPSIPAASLKRRGRPKSDIEKDINPNDLDEESCATDAAGSRAARLASRRSERNAATSNDDGASPQRSSPRRPFSSSPTSPVSSSAASPTKARGRMSATAAAHADKKNRIELTMERELRTLSGVGALAKKPSNPFEAPEGGGKRRRVVIVGYKETKQGLLKV